MRGSSTQRRITSLLWVLSLIAVMFLPERSMAASTDPVLVENIYFAQNQSQFFFDFTGSLHGGLQFDDAPHSNTGLYENDFADRVGVTNPQPYANTPFECPESHTCDRHIDYDTWVYNLRLTEDLTTNDKITITTPPGTILSSDPLDYVLAYRLPNAPIGFSDPYFPLQTASSFSSFLREGTNRVVLGMPYNVDVSDDDLSVFLNNVQNPAYGVHAGETFRAETSQQDEFPGSSGVDVGFNGTGGAWWRNSTLIAGSEEFPVEEAKAGTNVNVTATVRDPYGNPVSGRTVVIQPVSSSAGVTGPPDTTTDDKGEVQFTFTDTHAEEVEFKARMATPFAAQPPDTTTNLFQTSAFVTFTPAEPDPEKSEFNLGSSVPVPADGSSTALLEVLIVDEFGNPDLDSEVTLIPEAVPGGPEDAFAKGTITPEADSVCADPEFVVPGAACANGIVTNGPDTFAIARVRVKSTRAETVKFKVLDMTHATFLEDEVEVPFVAGAPSILTIGPDHQTVVADNTDFGAVTVTLKDANGNPNDGFSVDLSRIGTGTSTIDTSPVTTNTDGEAEFHVRGPDIESDEFQATYNGTIGATPYSGSVPGVAKVDFTAGDATATESSVSADSTSALADGIARRTVLVTLRDSSGRPAVGHSVSVDGNAGHHSTITPVAIGVGASGCPNETPAGVSDCNGQATFTVTDSTVEEVTYTASVHGGAVVVNDTVTIDFTKAPDVDQSTLTTTPSSLFTGETSTVVAHLVDSNGNPVRGKEICLTQNAGSAPGTPPCPSGPSAPSTVTPDTITTADSGCPVQVAAGTTDCNGDARFLVTSMTAQDVTYGIVDMTDFPNQTLGHHKTITFVAAPTEAGQSTVVSDIDEAVANGGGPGGSPILTVTLRDGSGNVLPSRPVALAGGTLPVFTPQQVPISESGCGAQEVAGTTDCNGVARFVATDTTPEAVVVSATDTTNSVVVTQTAAIRFIEDEASTGIVDASPSTVFANGGGTNGTSIITVTLGPTVPLVDHEVSLSGSGGPSSITAVPISKAISGCPTQAPAGTSDCHGHARFTVSTTTPGTVTYTAFDKTTGATIADTASVLFQIPPPSITSLDPSTGTTLGGTVVTLHGLRFSTDPGGTTVTFGGVPGTGVSCSSTTFCVATSPAAPAGDVPVVATTASGASSPKTYTYAIPVPVVDSISPESGPSSGGTKVVIRGEHLDGATSVSFGGALVPAQVIDATKVMALTPTTKVGTVDVQVSTAGGQSVVNPNVRFDFEKHGCSYPDDPARDAYQPDAAIKLANDRCFHGVGKFSQKPKGQTANKTVRRGSVSFDIQVANAGTTADAFRVLGCTTNRPGYALTYFDNAHDDVSSAAEAGTFITPILSPAETYTMHLVVQITGNARPNVVCLTGVTAVSDPTTPQVIDVVKALVERG